MTELESVMVRIAVLENLCLAALTLYLGNLRNDPDFSKSHAMIDVIQRQIEQSIAHLPLDMRNHGAEVAQDLLDRVRRSLSEFHGRPAGSSH